MRGESIKQKAIHRQVIVALSGGVDSSVSAALLKRAGFDVVGVHFKLLNGKHLGLSRAKKVARQLQIPFYSLDVKDQFQKEIITPFLRGLAKGLTPNPCVFCNQGIKFHFLFEKMKQLKADFVATGHYALRREIKNQKSNLKNINKNLKIVKLFRAKDKQKDQTYFLWKLKQKDLSKIIFPLGGYNKAEIRQIAEKANLITAKAKESQEVCFVKGLFNNFLEKKLGKKQGKVVDLKGKVLGKHQGLWFYTLGQRKGLPLQQGPWFVVKKNFKNNFLIVSKNQKDLLKKEVFFEKSNWLVNNLAFPFKARAKVRSQGKLADCLVNENKAIFTKAQQAVTPGQSIVFYQQNQLLGGAIIK